MKRTTFFAAVLALAGCNAQDADALGKLGTKLQAKTKKVLLDEPNGKFTRTLPLLQPPGVSNKVDKDVDAPSGTRLNTEEP